MKKIILLLIAVFMIVSCGKTVKNDELKDLKNKKSSILYSLPQDVEGVINIKSINSVFTNFKITENSAFGQKIEDRDFNEIKDILSINPLNIKELESIGIDTNKELGIFFDSITLNDRGNDFSSVNMVIYVPLKDSKTMMTFIENKFNNEKTKKMSINYLKENNYIKVFGNRKDEAVYIFTKNDYLFLVLNPLSPESSLKETTDMLSNKMPTVDSKIFEESITNNGIYFYGNIEKVIKNNEKIIQEQLKNSKLALNLINTYKSITGILALDTKEFSLNMSTVLNKDSQVFKIFQNIEYNNSTILGLDKSALMLLSFGTNVQEYVNLIKSFANEYFNVNYSNGKNQPKDEVESKMNKEIKKLNERFGFDIEKDLIANFDGNFSFATYDGMSISTTNYNSIISVGFKNPKVIETVIDKLLNHKDFKQFKGFVNKTTYNDKTIYIINAMVTQIYVGFKNNELIIASSKDSYDSALNSKKETGFYKYSAKDPKLLNSVKSSMILYVSFLEIIKALNNFKSMLPKENTQEVIDTLELLDYFLATSKIKDTTFSGNLTLKTNSDKLFFIALIDYINEMNAKK